MSRERSGERGLALIRNEALLLAALALHVSVHLIQQPGGGTAIPMRLWVAAGLLIALVVWALRLAVRRDRRAAAASAFAGFGTAAATLLGHAAPAWGALSESYWSAGAHANAVSWLALGLVCAIGLWTGAAGLKTMRAERPEPR